MAEKKKAGELEKNQRAFQQSIASEREQLVSDAGKLRARIVDFQGLSAGVGNARENFEAGRSLALLADITHDGMRAKLGSGGLASPEDAITSWKVLFRAPGGGGVDFGEIGRVSAPLVLDIPLWQVMRGPFKVPKKERKLAVKGQRSKGGKEELEAAGDKVVIGETSAQDLKTNAQEGAVSKRDAILGIHLREVWARDKAAVDCADGKRRELVPFFATMVDPWSYTQTVENMFYLSCRVKTGTAGIYLGLDDSVYLRPFNPEDLATGDDGVVGVVDDSKLPAPGAAVGGRAGGSGHAPRAAAGGVKQAITGTNQFVLQLDWQSWKRLVTDLRLAKPVLPHRTTKECSYEHAPCIGHPHHVDGKGKAAPAQAAVGSPGAGGGHAGSKRRAETALARDD